MKKREFKNFTKRTKLYCIGNKCHPALDNLITLSKSNNDEYDTVLDYIFYLVLNITPREYMNLFESDYGLTEEEIQDSEDSFQNYKEKVKLSGALRKQLKDMVSFIRKKALLENRIKKKGDIYLPDEEFYNIYYIQNQMLLFYKELKNKNI